ncbi:MAG: endo-1,4-beta-xylanase [candidate division KSB1 bacterium]|nr:endo-1,4-beta-xylanase [candidate division KSB1 bacterium]
MRKKSIIVLGLFLLHGIAAAQPLAAGREKFLGNIINDGNSIPYKFAEIWNQVTPENAGKWGSVEGIKDNYNWANLDKIYQFAKKRNFPFRMHTLVWGQQQPGWIGSLPPDKQREQVEEWIRLVSERYPEIDFIDVVNEPLHETPVYAEALGGKGATGWDWVIWSFEKARQYFPNAKLHINDYHILTGLASISDYLKIINLLKDRGLIDGIGCQGHFLESTSSKLITSRLNQLAKAGLPIYITEYDVNIADDTKQLNVFKDQFPAIYEHPAVAGMTLWGYMQGQMWRSDGYLIRSNGKDRPAMTWLRSYFNPGTSVQSAAESTPQEWRLEQNFPNPCNSSTVISFYLPEASTISLIISDASGRTVRTLAIGEHPEGKGSVVWDGLDEQKVPAASGVYFYTLQGGGRSHSFAATRKLLLIR